mmetsp:Transcript_90335/g.255770  ORF Transcript_90335/g.255770 Transcript_90335/m.255770 type:complete len:398 (-) Transcript_90335:397-1590(-)
MCSAKPVELREQRDELRGRPCRRRQLHAGHGRACDHRHWPQWGHRPAPGLRQLVQSAWGWRRRSIHHGHGEHEPRRRLLLAEDAGRVRRLQRDAPLRQEVRPLRRQVLLRGLAGHQDRGATRPGGGDLVRLPGEAARSQRALRPSSRGSPLQQHLPCLGRHAACACACALGAASSGPGHQQQFERHLQRPVRCHTGQHIWRQLRCGLPAVWWPRLGGADLLPEWLLVLWRWWWLLQAVHASGRQLPVCWFREHCPSGERKYVNQAAVRVQSGQHWRTPPCPTCDVCAIGWSLGVHQSGNGHQLCRSCVLASDEGPSAVAGTHAYAFTGTCVLASDDSPSAFAGTFANAFTGACCCCICAVQLCLWAVRRQGLERAYVLRPVLHLPGPQRELQRVRAT